MDKPIFITHIPKTAGTSFKEGIIETNFREDDIYRFQGLKKLIFDKNRNKKIFMGHFPYGINKILFLEGTYYTFLRDPIERSISHYYWVLDTKTEHYEHPAWKLHINTPLKNIFNVTRKSRHKTNFFTLTDNLQTRYLAGLGQNFLGKSSAYMLDKAKQHLEKKYPVFGIQEKFSESIKLFQTYYNVRNFEKKIEKKTTKKILFDQLDKETQATLLENHQLDQKLYEFAIERFELLLTQNKSS
jgi:hypothetical protein